MAAVCQAAWAVCPAVCLPVLARSKGPKRRLYRQIHPGLMGPAGGDFFTVPRVYMAGAFL
ncbi:hypothetical protein MNKW57_18430 [Biformimicrobium ophioploci]|uniref:Uncharacterized protein n=1 Tax=Biformimicrobium ophioploci TaxID=3036711 RepID=A0ABQ6LZQ1_9GAMM|nr:hypothetical protein MNKW57_18430 [Microbulbifer sp. NKW57]